MLRKGRGPRVRRSSSRPPPPPLPSGLGLGLGPLADRTVASAVGAAVALSARGTRLVSGFAPGALPPYRRYRDGESVSEPAPPPEVGVEQPRYVKPDWVYPAAHAGRDGFGNNFM